MELTIVGYSDGEALSVGGRLGAVEVTTHNYRLIHGAAVHDVMEACAHKQLVSGR